MAIIPTYKSNVSRTAVNLPRANTSAPAEAFGSGIGRALTSVGADIGYIAKSEKAIDDETKAKEIETAYTREVRDLLHNPDSGYYTTKGKDAYLSKEKVQQKLDELKAKYTGLAENDSQRMMFERVANARHERALDGIYSYASQERRNWQIATSQARADEQIEIAISNRNDDKTISQSVATGRMEIIKQAEMAGLDGEAAQARVKDYQEKFHSAIVAAYLRDKEPAAAKEYLDKHITEIGAAASGKLRELIDKQGLDAKGQEVADKVMAMGLSLEEGLAYARKNYSGKEEDAIVTRIKARHAERVTAENIADRNARLEATRIVRSGKSPDEIPVDVMSRLSATMRKQLWDEHMGIDKPTDPDDYAKLLDMMVDEDRVEDFVNEDLSKYQLSRAYRLNLEEKQAALSSKEAKASRKSRALSNAMKVVKPILLESGIDVTPKEGSKAAKIYGQFYDRMSQYLDDLPSGTHLDDRQIIDIAKTMLTEVYVRDSGIFSDNKKPRFMVGDDESSYLVKYGDIPGDWVKWYAEQFYKANNRPPKKDEVEDAYSIKLTREGVKNER